MVGGIKKGRLDLGNPESKTQGCADDTQAQKSAPPGGGINGHDSKVREAGVRREN